MTVIDADHDHDHRHEHGGLQPNASDPKRGSLASWLTRLVSTPWRIGLVAAAAVLAIDAGGTDDGPGICVFRRCTGGYCPGCGLTRSARHLTRGQVGAAWQDHPFIVLLAIQSVVAGVLYAAFGRLRSRLRAPRTLATIAAVNGVMVLVIWIVRLVDGSIPRFF